MDKEFLAYDNGDLQYEDGSDRLYQADDEFGIRIGDGIRGHKDIGAAERVRYIIARAPGSDKTEYYLTETDFKVGDWALDQRDGIRVKVLAAVECLAEAVPAEARSARPAGKL